MFAKASHRQLSIVATIALVLVAAVLGGFGAAVSANHEPSGHYAIPFGNSVQQFCADEGVIDHAVLDYVTFAEGFKSPEAAVREYETSVHRAASMNRFAEVTGRAAPADMVEMLRPSRTWRTSMSGTSADGALIHFDTPSSIDGVIDARVVVGRFDDHYLVLGASRCESLIVTDLERFEQRLAEEIKR